MCRTLGSHTYAVSVMLSRMLKMPVMIFFWPNACDKYFAKKLQSNILEFPHQTSQNRITIQQFCLPVEYLLIANKTIKSSNFLM